MSPRALLRLSARRAVLGLALALVAAGTSSCDLTDDSGSFDHFTLEDATPQDVATIEGTSLRLAVGAVVAVTVKCFDAENKPIGEVTLGKNDDEPMGAAATKSANVFVFYGRRSGTGTVPVEVDGTVVGTITTTVPLAVRAHPPGWHTRQTQVIRPPTTKRVRAPRHRGQAPPSFQRCAKSQVFGYSQSVSIVSIEARQTKRVAR